MSTPISVRLTDADRERLEAAAGSEPLSTFIRRAALRAIEDPDLLRRDAYVAERRAHWEAEGKTPPRARILAERDAVEQGMGRVLPHPDHGELHVLIEGSDENRLWRVAGRHSVSGETLVRGEGTSRSSALEDAGFDVD